MLAFILIYLVVGNIVYTLACFQWFFKTLKEMQLHKAMEHPTGFNLFRGVILSILLWPLLLALVIIRGMNNA